VCGGFGYLPFDFDRNCYVDANDLETLLEYWLAEDPNGRFDLFEDGQNLINILDFAVFADGWLTNTYWENWQQPGFSVASLPDADAYVDGIINLRDYAVWSRRYLAEGGCSRADIDASGTVDLADLVVLEQHWLGSGSL